MESWKILIFGLVFASLVVNSSTSAQRTKRESKKWINENFIKIQDKFQFIDKKMEQLESKGNYTFDAHEIIENITHLIVQLNDENAKKFEERFKNIEGNFKKMEMFEDKFKNIEGNVKNIEGNVKHIEGNVKNIEGNVKNIEGNVKNIEGNLKKMEKFEDNFKNIEGNFKNIEGFLNKSEKCETQLNGIESILLQLKKASDVCGGVTSLCTCAHNATTISVKANSEPTDFRNTSLKNETKALNACHSNPCLHGGICRLNSTGSGYKCECLKFTSGSRCEDVDCSVEKKCYRFKDTLYVVIETRLTWAEAKVKCEGLNMTLAMPKDEERTRFLRDQLKPIYTTHPYYFLWIGLKCNASGWWWVDGSALGEYTGGDLYMKSVTLSISGHLFVGDGGSHMWGGYFATEQRYSICETHIFTN